ncbi:helix-turn-helix domain-containing protein [Sporanaerobacter acetigenes]|uniref:DNA-binding transcriptional regulator, XRE-family HTH domain n=1 Tax=Sporanaerobacter acetigenes DSM 13106 TaxID=1123281 RepID=A0A1M5U6K8_9FIRM|nr:helix-turn-helix transcriptional regulator [Sporanaerobacter acetigenes]SHH58353.1 DNA-binding transcriptional regulator, XRE-family HTH domain [Sporanaerobacter acetigenes DSM 13106]
MNNISLFKYRLKTLRKEYKMTQENLAEKLGLVRTAIANYETGRTTPDAETLSLIADIFNTTTDYLLGRTDIRKRVNNSERIEKKPSIKDELSEEIHNLSPQSQEEIKKLIDLYKIKDMQDKNTELSDEISKPD